MEWPLVAQSSRSKSFGSSDDEVLRKRHESTDISRIGMAAGHRTIVSRGL
jgi:hypothetical protein